MTDRAPEAPEEAAAPASAAGPAGLRANERAVAAAAEPALKRYFVLALQTGAMTLSGYVVAALAAYYFGAGSVKDAWDVAFVVPTVLLAVAGFESFQGITTAIFSRLLARGEDDAGAVLTTLTAGLGAGALVIAAAGFVWREPIVRLVAPGLAPASAAIAARELGILLWTVPLMGLATFVGAVQVAYGRAGSNEVAWLSARLVVIACLVIAPASLGITRLSLGFLVGGALTLAVQLRYLRRTGLRFAPRLALRSPHVREAGAQGALFFLVTLTGQACVIAARDLASRGPEGTIAALGYAIALLGPLYQFVSKPLMLIEGPRVVRAQEKSSADALRRYDRVVLIGLGLVVPAVITLWALRQPVVRLLFQRGHLDAAGSARIAGFLAVLAFSAIGECLAVVSAIPAIVQRRARWVPVGVSSCSLVQLAFMYLAFPRLSMMAIVWGTLLGSSLKGLFAISFSRWSLRRASEAAPPSDRGGGSLPLAPSRTPPRSGGQSPPELAS